MTTLNPSFGISTAVLALQPASRRSFIEHWRAHVMVGSRMFLQKDSAISRMLILCIAFGWLCLADQIAQAQLGQAVPDATRAQAGRGPTAERQAQPDLQPAAGTQPSGRPFSSHPPLRPLPKPFNHPLVD